MLDIIFYVLVLVIPFLLCYLIFKWLPKIVVYLSGWVLSLAWYIYFIPFAEDLRDIYFNNQQIVVMLKNMKLDNWIKYL